MLPFYQWCLLLVGLYLLLTTLYNLRHMLHLPVRDPLSGPLPLISVLIPARNEAHNIRPCLESLLRQDYPNLEIIVLDDDSSDATPELVRQLAASHRQVRLLQGQPLPPGWHGKAWACHQLAQYAKGEWFLFVDADTRHQPNAISAALSIAAARRLDLLSLLPDMSLKTFGERILMAVIPFVFVAGLPHFVYTQSRQPVLAAALGPFMLFRRETYERCGGHQAVRGDIVDDIFLARCIKRVGGRIALADGVSVLRVSFYNGFHEAWNGLKKSVFATFDYSLGSILLTLAVAFMVILTPYYFVYQAWTQGLSDLVHFWLPLGQIALTWIAAWHIDGRFLIPRAYAFLIALTVLLAILFSLSSVASCIFGPGVVWKGRTYQFRGAGAAAGRAGWDPNRDHGE